MRQEERDCELLHGRQALVNIPDDFRWFNFPAPEVHDQRAHHVDLSLKCVQKRKAIAEVFFQTDSGAPPMPRYNSLTAWRGAACLLVIIYHSLFARYSLAFPDGVGQTGFLMAIMRRGWLGVPLFFVISGYCVTASADAARRRPNPGFRFFWRRFHRIYPPYWIWFAITAVTVMAAGIFDREFFGRFFISNPRNFTTWQWFGNLTLTETWIWHLTGGTVKHLIDPSWTLCYEEQFYALTGVALLFARRFFFGALALVTILVIARVFFVPIGSIGLFTDGKWLIFAAGAWVYYALNYIPARARIIPCIPIGVGIVFSLATPGNLLKQTLNEPNLSYLAGFTFSLFLIMARQWDADLCRARILQPLFFCGERCYSMYLVHWPTVAVAAWGFNQLGCRNPWVIFFLGNSVCLAVTIGLAILFYRLVERRFLNPAYSRRESDAGNGTTLMES